MPPQRVVELSNLLAHSLRQPPRRERPGVCRVCSTFCPGYDECYACAGMQQHLDAVVPISFSVGLGQLHSDLRGYKDARDSSVRRQLQIRLTAVLYRFIEQHEACIAHAARVDSFDLVTTVPARDRARDDVQPLRMMVGEWCRPISGRYERLLKRTDSMVAAHAFDVARYAGTRELSGEAVLRVEDTWTTGASAQSAAAVLKEAGAGAVGAVVVGRHINRGHGNNAELLDSLPYIFDWQTCWRHAP